MQSMEANFDAVNRKMASSLWRMDDDMYQMSRPMDFFPFK